MHIIVFIFSFFFSFFCFSQEPSYHHYNTHNGLPSSEIYDVIQDKYGYLWFSSNFGLSRYDGYKFQQYTTEDGLTNNIVYNFFKDPNGDIWCSTGDHSLFIITGETPNFTPYKWNKKIVENSIYGAIKEVVITDKKRVYITFIGLPGYLSIDDVGTIKRLDSPVQPDKPLWFSVVYKNNSCFNIFGEHKPSQNIADFNLLSFKFNSSPWRNISLHLPKKEASVLNSNETLIILKKGKEVKINFPSEILNLNRFSDSTFWVSTRGSGVYIYNTDGDELESLLPGKSVTGFTLDDQGGVWATTLNNGVFHFKNRNIKSRKLNTVSSNTVSLVSHKESLYIGYVNGEIIKYSNKGVTKKRPFTLNRPTYFYCNELAQDLYAYSIGSLTKNEKIIDITNSHLDHPLTFSKGGKEVLMLFNRHVISEFENQQLKKTFENTITGKINSVLVANNDIYIGGNNGLFTFKNEKLKPIFSLAALNNSRINTIQKHRNNLILGTAGQGIIFYNYEKPTLHLTTKDGLTSNFIQKIFVQNDKTIWVATNSGLNKITISDKNEYLIQQITAKDGLINNEINDIALHNDTIWIATKTGLSYFHHATRFGYQNSINNFLKISGLKVNDKNVIPDITRVHLDYDENRVEINFGSISFNENESPLYRYKLKNLETNWNYSTSQKAVYPGLQPGKYTFVVQLKGENSAWSTQSKTLFITVHPPFWKTNWFLILTTCLIILFNYLFFKYRILRFNGALLREILRLTLKRLKKNSPSIIVKEGPEKVKILSKSIKYVEAEGNYIKIYHDNGKTMTRKKISEFLEIIPDKIEYIQVRRSYIVRIDRIEQKGKKSIVVGGETINVGSTYLSELEKIVL